MFDLDPTISILDRLAYIGELRSRTLQGRENPLDIRLDKLISPTEAVISGRPTIMMGTNNYLGLTFDPKGIEAAREALSREGVATTASRAASGTYPSHAALEREIAAMLGKRHAILFSTGFMANLGVIAGLLGKGDVVLLDEDCHASIHDACVLSRAETITFAHNDAEDLDRKLMDLKVSRGRVLVVVESVYSVLGDVAPLVEFVEVKNKHGVLLVVDEAHSVGAYGPHGRGVCAEQGVTEDVDIIVGTMSKSFGAIGGFAAGDYEHFPSLRFRARSYLYTASLPPPVVASARSALARFQQDDVLRQKLWRNARRLHEGLTRQGWDLPSPPAPIVAISIAGVLSAYETWRKLLEYGVYVNLLFPPGTPRRMNVLRASVSAAHESAQIDAALDIFRQVSRELDDFRAVAHGL